MRREAEKVLRDKVTKESESPGNGVCPASAVLHFALELGDKGEGLLSFSPFQNDYISVRKKLLQPLVKKGWEGLSSAQNPCLEELILRLLSSFLLPVQPTLTVCVWILAHVAVPICKCIFFSSIW